MWFMDTQDTQVYIYVDKIESLRGTKKGDTVITMDSGIVHHLGIPLTQVASVLGIGAHRRLK